MKKRFAAIVIALFVWLYMAIPNFTLALTLTADDRPGYVCTTSNPDWVHWIWIDCPEGTIDKAYLCGQCVDFAKGAGFNGIRPHECKCYDIDCATCYHARNGCLWWTAKPGWMTGPCEFRFVQVQVPNPSKPNPCECPCAEGCNPTGCPASSENCTCECACPPCVENPAYGDGHSCPARDEDNCHECVCKPYICECACNLDCDCACDDVHDCNGECVCTCSVEPTPTPIPNPTPSPEPTPELTPTPMPESSPEPITESSEPEPEATPNPTSEPAPMLAETSSPVEEELQAVYLAAYNYISYEIKADDEPIVVEASTYQDTLPQTGELSLAISLGVGAAMLVIGGYVLRRKGE